MPERLRLAIVGCGAITADSHLPAAVQHSGVDLVALVDSDAQRARTLAERFQLDCRVEADYGKILPQTDAIINALPNHMHARVNLECLNAGVHVLCEKPLATTAADARACCQKADEKNLILAVGMNRRFFGSHHLLHLILKEGSLGVLRSYDWEYGGVLDWKSASGFYFSHSRAGGGVLIDFGVHLLDSLFDWFGPIADFEYQDDDWGSGLEANAILHLRHRSALGEISGRLRVSRTYPLKNRLWIRGSQAEAQILSGDPDVVVLHRKFGSEPLSETLRLPDLSATSTFYKQLDNFVESIRGNQKIVAEGWQGAHVLELIEDCYAHRRRIPEPWSQSPPDASAAE